MMWYALAFLLAQAAETPAEPATPPAEAVELDDSADVDEAVETLPDVLMPVRVPGTRVALMPLPGFGLADTFAGMTSPELGATILVVELPASYEEAAPSLSRSTLEAQGVEVKEHEDITVSGLPATLVYFPQTENETEYLKWAVIFGNETESVLMTASFPAELEEDVSAAMKAAVLAATWTPEEISDPFESMPFTVAEPLGYKVMTRLANSLVLTKDGALPGPDAMEPVILIGYTRTPLGAADKKRFAQDRLVATEGVKNPEATRLDETTVGDLPAVIIEATATDADSDAPIAFYQAVIFGDKRHFIIQGSAPVEKAEALGILCGNVVQSFQKKVE